MMTMRPRSLVLGKDTPATFVHGLTRRDVEEQTLEAGTTVTQDLDVQRALHEHLASGQALEDFFGCLPGDAQVEVRVGQHIYRVMLEDVHGLYDVEQATGGAAHRARRSQED